MCVQRHKWIYLYVILFEQSVCFVCCWRSVLWIMMNVAWISLPERQQPCIFFFLNKAFPEFMSHFWEWIMHMGMVWKCMAWEFSNNKDICKPFPFLSVFFFIFPILLCIWPPFNRLVKIWRGRKSLGEAIAQREAEPPDGQMAGLFRKFPGRRRKHATLHQEA